MRTNIAPVHTARDTIYSNSFGEAVKVGAYIQCMGNASGTVVL